MNNTKLRGLWINHPKKDGKGAALRLTMEAANSVRAGGYYFTIADQIGDREGVPAFDWVNAETIRLDAVEACEVLSVYLGEVASIRDGQGIVHRSKRKQKLFACRHLVEPETGYRVEIFVEGETESKKYETLKAIELTNAEMAAVYGAVENTLGSCVFGDPVASDHETREG